MTTDSPHRSLPALTASILLLLSITSLFLPLSFALCSPAPALDWHDAQGYRWAQLTVPGPARTGFELLPSSLTGLQFTNLLTEERGLTNQIFMNGSGLALGDVDADGWVDIFLCGIDSPNRLYRNRGGWKFEDITAAAGLAAPNQASTGAVFADIDGDGDLDLLVSSIGGGVRLFLNDGRAHFAETTDSAGLRTAAASTSMALADIDGTGTLALYVANYRTGSIQDDLPIRVRLSARSNPPVITMIDGKPVTPEQLRRFSFDPETSSILENGEPDILYRNDGHGKFSPVSWTDGNFLDEDGKPASVPHDWGLSVLLRDLNNDGRPDIYVCNDNQSPDRIWMNLGQGRFQAIPRRHAQPRPHVAPPANGPAPFTTPSRAHRRSAPVPA